jgi:hypothetical protein
MRTYLATLGRAHNLLAQLLEATIIETGLSASELLVMQVAFEANEPSIGCSPRRRSIPRMACLWRLCEEPGLEGAHRRFLGRFGVVPATDVEGAVGRQKAQLVGGGPADVAGLAAVAGLGLLDGALDGDDDVANVLSATGWQCEVGGRGPARWIGDTAGMGREGPR